MLNFLLHILNCYADSSDMESLIAKNNLDKKLNSENFNEYLSKKQNQKKFSDYLEENYLDNTTIKNDVESLLAYKKLNNILDDEIMNSALKKQSIKNDMEKNPTNNALILEICMDSPKNCMACDTLDSIDRKYCYQHLLSQKKYKNGVKKDKQAQKILTSALPHQMGLTKDNIRLLGNSMSDEGSCSTELETAGINNNIHFKNINGKNTLVTEKIPDNLAKNIQFTASSSFHEEDMNSSEEEDYEIRIGARKRLLSEMGYDKPKHKVGHLKNSNGQQSPSGQSGSYDNQKGYKKFFHGVNDKKPVENTDGADYQYTNNMDPQNSSKKTTVNLFQFTNTPGVNDINGIHNIDSPDNHHINYLTIHKSPKQPNNPPFKSRLSYPHKFSFTTTQNLYDNNHAGNQSYRLGPFPYRANEIVSNKNDNSWYDKHTIDYSKPVYLNGFEVKKECIRGTASCNSSNY